MLPVERSMRHVTYYGYGPDESYIDKREHCYVDMFQAEVEDLHEIISDTGEWKPLSLPICLT